MGCENANANNLSVSELIKEKAFILHRNLTLHMKIYYFDKRRNNIRCYRLHGETNSAPLETLFEKRRKLQSIL